MKYLTIISILAILAAVAYAGPTPVADPLPDDIYSASHQPRQPRHKHKHKPKATPKPPTPSLCAQKDIAFGAETCTFVYQYFGNKATALVVYQDCVIEDKSEGPAPSDVSSTADWSYAFPFQGGPTSATGELLGCNYLRMNGVVYQNWKPTNKKYYMPLYQNDGQIEVSLSQRGPSMNNADDPKTNCTLKYDNLSGGALYAWICPFHCPC
ncbi:hypothetical protein DSL72_002781 [Monilinia vaccinii-corymbosi]|uniref:AA1-like domain-containing protein n=1 Tax=Monilinia vaccinii-corymbosi TaxID=61207 RepID=A0A8A3PDN6_9HELO|nr:hypothetical protein DSL72_002781 [Monilinia vaccinii-corymbosi]